MDEILAKVKGVEERNATLAAELSHTKRMVEDGRRAAQSHAEAEGKWKARELEMQRDLGTKTSHLTAMENELKQNKCAPPAAASTARGRAPPPPRSLPTRAPAPCPSPCSEDQRRGATELKETRDKLEQALGTIRKLEQDFQVAVMRLGAQVQGAPAAAEGGSMAP